MVVIPRPATAQSSQTLMVTTFLPAMDQSRETLVMITTSPPAMD